MLQTELSFSWQDEKMLKMPCFPGIYSTDRGLNLCFIIIKLELCTCARLSSSSLGNIGAEIAVLSWNNFYCQGTTALFHNQETVPLLMLQTEL
jgi:hypothetical protein